MSPHYTKYPADPFNPNPFAVQTCGTVYNSLADRALLFRDHADQNRTDHASVFVCTGPGVVVFTGHKRDPTVIVIIRIAAIRYTKDLLLAFVFISHSLENRLEKSGGLALVPAKMVSK